MNLLEKITALEEEAARFGFKWENPYQIMDQIQSECLEINAHLKDSTNNADRTQLQEEIGDLLHAVFSLCVFCQCDPQETLEKAVEKFERRLKAVKQIAMEKGLETLKDYSFNDLMVFWEQAKRLVG
jgi:uncharacterized protein YabN with tetrapyrrole methylase and pyrophosphatase domain